jgi:predicted MFS family arabinose efflux permease
MDETMEADAEIEPAMPAAPLAAKPTKPTKPTKPLKPEISAAEWGLLLTLAGIQLTNVLDFVILMPLGPQIIRSFAIEPWQFGLLVSAYGFAASGASLLGVVLLDRFDRKKSLLVLYIGFIASTLICAVARDFSTMLVGRFAAGACGGVLAAGVLAVVGDVFADYRRATAMGVVMSAFSVASIFGIPIGLMAAEHFGTGAPFALLAGVCALNWIFAAWSLPALRSHMRENHDPPLAVLITVLSQPNHWRAFAFMVALVLSSFMIVPYIATYMEFNVGLAASQIKYIYFFGGICTLFTMNVIGRVSDRFGKLFVFRIMAVATVGMTFAITTLAPSSLAFVLLITTLYMVTSSSRMVPAQAMITGSAAAHLRGGFLSMTAAVQHLSIGLATLWAGMLMQETKSGKISGYWLVGLVASLAAALAILLAGQMRSGEGDADEVIVSGEM